MKVTKIKSLVAIALCAVGLSAFAEPEISAESEAFAFDVREEIALAEGAVTIADVSWSATLWGKVDETFTTVGWANLTTVYFQPRVGKDSNENGKTGG